MDIDIKEFLKPKGISAKRNIDVRDSLGVVLNRIRLADLLEEYYEYRINNDNKFVLTPEKYGKQTDINTELLEALKNILPIIGYYGDLHITEQKRYLAAENAILKATK